MQLHQCLGIQNSTYNIPMLVVPLSFFPRGLVGADLERQFSLLSSGFFSPSKCHLLCSMWLIHEPSLPEDDIPCHVRALNKPIDFVVRSPNFEFVKKFSWLIYFNTRSKHRDIHGIHGRTETRLLSLPNSNSSATRSPSEIDHYSSGDPRL